MTQNKVYIWTGFFNDQTDFEQYIAANDLWQDEPIDDDEDETPMSLFCEDIDLPHYDIAFAKTQFLTESDVFPRFLDEVAAWANIPKGIDAIVSKTGYAAFNALLVIKHHAHTRYYRGGARPGAPVRFVGCFEE
jgi:hypothetical protein